MKMKFRGLAAAVVVASTLFSAAAAPALAQEKLSGRDARQQRRHTALAWLGVEPIDPGSRLSDEQRENIAKLLTDLERIRSESEVTPEMRDAVRDSLLAVVEGANPPSRELVEALAADLIAAWEDQTLTPVEKMILLQGVVAVLDSANIPLEEVEALIEAIGVLLTATNVDAEDVALIVADLQAIADEVRNNL